MYPNPQRVYPRHVHSISDESFVYKIDKTYNMIFMTLWITLLYPNPPQLTIVLNC